MLVLFIKFTNFRTANKFQFKSDYRAWDNAIAVLTNRRQTLLSKKRHSQNPLP